MAIPIDIERARVRARCRVGRTRAHELVEAARARLGIADASPKKPPQPPEDALKDAAPGDLQARFKQWVQKRR